MQIRISTFLALCIASLFSLNAEITADWQGFEPYLAAPNLKNGKILGSIQMLKGKKDGVGLSRHKDGCVYFGDFVNGKPDGHGIMITPAGTENYLPGGFRIISGRWTEGKPAGNCRGYDSEGRLIFKGKIIDGKLTAAADQEKDLDMMFAINEEDGAVYVGEVNALGAHGSGMFLLPDKTFFISNFKDGTRRGPGTYIFSDHSWITEAYRDGVSEFVSSSAEYDAIVSNTEGIRKKFAFNWGELLTALSEGLSTINQALTSGSSSSSATSGGYTSSACTSSHSASSSGKATKNSNGMLSPSEQQNLNRDRNTYHNYDGQLAAIFAGNREAPCSHVKDIQSKMRGIRQKWEKRGQSFPHFTNEDRDCAGR